MSGAYEYVTSGPSVLTESTDSMIVSLVHSRKISQYCLHVSSRLWFHFVELIAYAIPDEGELESTKTSAGSSTLEK